MEDTWKYDPFEMHSVDGWLYGRGTTDNKGERGAGGRQGRRRRERGLCRVYGIQGFSPGGSGWLPSHAFSPPADPLPTDPMSRTAALPRAAPPPPPLQDPSWHLSTR